jgi:predicted RNA-binding Zn-ribbon protein involved in translation (DUF1610 family)
MVKLNRAVEVSRNNAVALFVKIPERKRMSSWCPNCGREVEGNEKFCRQCGMPLSLTGEEASTWILSQPTMPNLDPPRPTKQVGQAPTAPNPQAGPAYAPPMHYYPQPQPPQYQPQAPAGHSHISLGDWLSGGWHVYKENALLMSVASFIAMALSFCTFGVMAGPLLMGLYRMAFKTMRGEQPEMADLFDFKGRFLQAFLAALIFFLIHVGFTGASRGGPLSVLLSFIITPLLTTTLGLTIPLMLERKLDVANAINEVGRIIFSRDAFMWWIVGLVFAAITTSGVAGCLIGLFVTLPWMICASAVAYRDVFGFDDPNRTLH